MHSRSFQKASWFLHFAALALITFNTLVAARIISYSGNNLQNNGNWISLKLLREMRLMGADEYMLSRSSVMRNRLHLNRWHGYQELYFKRQVREPVRISFDFELPTEKSYLTLILRKDRGSFYGFRLSRYSALPSGVLVGGPGEKYHRQESAFGEFSVPESGHFEFHLSAAGEAKVWIDGVEHRLRQAPKPDSYWVGLRGALSPSSVDNFHVIGADLDYFDDFSNSRNPPRVEIFCFLGILLAGIFFALVFSRLQARRMATIHGCVQLWLACFLTAYYAWDYHAFSGLYLRSFSSPPDSALLERDYLFFRIEQLRRKIFQIEPAGLIPMRFEEGFSALSSWRGFVSEGKYAAVHFSEKYPGFYTQWKHPGDVSLPPADYRVLFLGTSQTRGIGADTFADSLPGRLFQRLRGLKKNGKTVDVLSCAQQGSNSAEQWNAYFSLCSKANPNLVVIDLANNDLSAAVLRENVEKMIRFALAHSSEVLLIEEPNSPENRYWVQEKYEMLEALSKTYATRNLHLGFFFRDPKIEDSGFIWWDSVHLTSYGYELMEGEVFRSIASALPRNIFRL